MVASRIVRGWNNQHETLPKQRVKIYRPSNESGHLEPRFKNGLSDLIEVAKEAARTNTSLSAMGSLWSLSDAVAPTGALVNTRYLGEIPAIGLSSRFSDHPKRDKMVFAQGGVEIAQLSRVLAKNDLSMQVSGASNGQTLAGAVSTGTHGSAFKIGGLAETVRGIHLVTRNGESLWIEPQSKPVTKPAWAQFLGARIERDDELFQACLVSFGSFGLIHGLMIECEPLYLLERHRYRRALGSLLSGLSRTGSRLNIAPALLPHGSNRLYHFEFLINPNDVLQKKAIVQAIYKRGTKKNYDFDDLAPNYQEVSGEALSFVSFLLNTVGRARLIPRGAITSTVKDLETRRYPSTGSQPEVGALGELFPRVHLIPGGNSMELGVDVNDAKASVETVLDVIRSMKRPFPGLVGVRFVKKTQATLGFTRFPVTCTIEVPAADSGYTKRLYRKIWKALADDGIFFTLHWGQAIDFRKIPLKYMYPRSQRERFKAARERLLGDRYRDLYENKLSKAMGLW